MWRFCVQHAIHLIKRLPTPLLKFKCPYELLQQQPPILIHLKAFGCLSFASTFQAHRSKFEPGARKAISLGFKEGTKGYILYDLQNHNLFVSIHVIFYETHFPFKSLVSPLTIKLDLTNFPIYVEPDDLSQPSSSTEISLPTEHICPLTNSTLQPGIDDSPSSPTSPFTFSLSY
ncbi:unnamed protein product [Vicia faba]|uniref:Retroviral polymerase SH3-like domain-containing protein n=1 Tax=Vicia faba TaxID=3906 RepID=A0AAV1AWF0_VICFA|nr:unnamed protein product [Vicia faba]